LRQRYAVDFAVHGDIRFIAHNDMVRLFSRACVRAELPVVFTEGYNPRVRLSLPFPRPVGQASDAERALIDFRETMDAGDLVVRLQAQMPDGLTVFRATTLSHKDTCPPRWVRYRIEPLPGDPGLVGERIAALLDSPEIWITRVRHRDRKSRKVDLRPFIDTIRVTGRALDVSVYVTDSGSAAPAEVCGALGMEADAINPLVRRVEIQWHNSPSMPTPTP